jgi:rhodanese-related sulfurtransferase
MGLLNMLFGNSAKEVETYLQKDAIILDVRTDGEYRADHISGAKHIPLQELEYRFQEIEKLNKPVIVHCASGMRSEKASKFLISCGIDAVNAGGIGALRQALK